MHRLVIASVASFLIMSAAFGQDRSGGQSHGAQAGNGQQLSQQDQHWLDYAATDNQGEIQESLLAEKKAHSPALKAFVRLMVNDHVQVESRLAALVNGQSVDVPDGPGQKNQKAISELERLHGDQFDHHFIQEQIKDHSDDIQKFSEEVHTSQNPDIRRFAIETLPILQQHLALAQAVQTALAETNQQKGQAGTTQ